MGLVKEDDVLRAFAEELGMDFVEVKQEQIDHKLLMQFPTTAVFRHSLLPLSRRNGSVVVATSDPFNLEALEELSAVSGFHLEPVLARRLDVIEMIKSIWASAATLGMNWWRDPPKDRADGELR